MRRLWIVVLAIMAIAAGASSGVTLAGKGTELGGFTSKVVAGRLAISVDRGLGDTLSGPMYYTVPHQGATPEGLLGLLPTGLWAPGDTFHRVLDVQNVGTLDATIKQIRAQYESGSRLLADRLEVKVTTDAAGRRVVASGTLGQFLDGPQLIPFRVDLDAGETTSLHFFVTLPREADNRYQGLTVAVRFGVYAEQGRHNDVPPPQLG